MFLSHARYFDQIDATFITKGVKNSLRKHVQFWERIGANQSVIDIIKKGYVIPFLKNPPSMSFRNNKSAFLHSEFVDGALKDLLDTGCIIKTPFQPFVVNPLSVAVQSSGKKRLILDLSELNLFIKKDKVKFEDWRVALNYFSRDCYLYKFDLKSGYFHFDVCVQQQTYLGFCWKNVFYCFTVLAFGLTSAPYVFIKCLRPMVKYWRENGVDIVLYLDDGLGMGRNLGDAMYYSSFVKKTLLDAGFLINMEKSIFAPVQSLEWLGLLWNSLKFTLSIPKRRIDNAINSINMIISNFPVFTARSLARATGKILSMSPIMGNITSLMTRYLYKEIEGRIRWDLNLQLEFPDLVHKELLFWSNNIANLNEKIIAGYSLPHVLVFSDASNVSAGGYFVRNSVGANENIFHQMWTSEEILMSSTWRELKAILLALVSFKNHLSNNCVKWHTDNKNCVSIVQKGSTKLHLQDLAIEIFKLCSERNISLDIVWIPRSDNTKADYISKIVDIDDWGTSREFFDFLDDMWGPHTVDRFASNLNKKVSRFNAKFWNPGVEAVDAFSQNWRNDTNWIVPPIFLVCKAIKHLVHCRAKGTLIVPRWPSSPFWTMIFEKGYLFKPYVIEVLDFKSGQNFFVHGMNTNSLFGSSEFNSDILAVRLNAEFIYDDVA